MKGCLLDQTIIAGIGNIYSDEILFAAGIYPGRPANPAFGLQILFRRYFIFFYKKEKPFRDHLGKTFPEGAAVL